MYATVSSSVFFPCTQGSIVFTVVATVGWVIFLGGFGSDNSWVKCVNIWIVFVNYSVCVCVCVCVLCVLCVCVCVHVCVCVSMCVMDITTLLYRPTPSSALASIPFYFTAVVFPVLAILLIGAAIQLLAAPSYKIIQALLMPFVSSHTLYSSYVGWRSSLFVSASQ